MRHYIFQNLNKLFEPNKLTNIELNIFLENNPTRPSGRTIQSQIRVPTSMRYTLHMSASHPTRRYFPTCENWIIQSSRNISLYIGYTPCSYCGRGCGWNEKRFGPIFQPIASALSSQWNKHSVFSQEHVCLHSARST